MFCFEGAGTKNKNTPKTNKMLKNSELLARKKYFRKFYKAMLIIAEYQRSTTIAIVIRL